MPVIDIAALIQISSLHSDIPGGELDTQIDAENQVQCLVIIKKILLAYSSKEITSCIVLNHGFF